VSGPKQTSRRRSTRKEALAYDAARRAFINADEPDLVTADRLRAEIERVLAEHGSFEDACSMPLDPPDVITVRYEDDLPDDMKLIEVLPTLYGSYGGKRDAFNGDGGGEPVWLYDVAVSIDEARDWLDRHDARMASVTKESESGKADSGTPAPPSPAPEVTVVASYDANASNDTVPATPTTDQYRQFQYLHGYFNEKLRLGVQAAMLAFSRKARTFGYFAADRWRDHGEDSSRVSEIALNPDCLSHTAREIAATIVHEMVHQWQHEHGEKKSRRGYHNAEWASKMENVGLMPSSTGKPGGNKTGAKMSDYVIEGGPFAVAFDELPPGALLPFISGGAEAGDGGLPKPPKPKDPSKTPFVCAGGCKSRMWGKPSLQATCKACGFDFVPVASTKTAGGGGDGAGDE
jgi:predicted SprT family Zn-dependent metalloprotease